MLVITPNPISDWTVVLLGEDKCNNMFRSLMLFIRIDVRRNCLIISLFGTVKSLCILQSQGNVFQHSKKSCELQFRPKRLEFYIFLAFF